jgi:uncharacterized protein YukE
MIGAHLDSVEDGRGIVDDGSVHRGGNPGRRRAENGDEDQKMRRQAKDWGGQAGERYDRCYHQACDNVDNINRDVLNHYLRALAGTLAHFATSTAELR